MSKRLLRSLVYVCFGVIAMAIAWTFYGVSGFNLVKVGVGSAAFLLLVDNIL